MTLNSIENAVTKADKQPTVQLMKNKNMDITCRSRKNSAAATRRDKPNQDELVRITNFYKESKFISPDTDSYGNEIACNHE